MGRLLVCQAWQTELSQKWTYVKKVMIDGISGLVAD
jgi:hypothetical protein